MVKVSTLLIAISIAASFFTTFALTKTWIRAARKLGLVGRDMNKADKRDVAEGGGIAVLFGLLSGLFIYIFFRTFFLDSQEHAIEMLAAVSAMLLAGFIGFVDDILGWKQGLRRWQKPFLTLPVAVPLMVTNVGHATMTLPIIGGVNLGILYPLFVIPVGIVGAANGFNMLAGLNGLEAGMGLIILAALGVVAYTTGFTWVALIAFLAAAAILAFWLFNKHPAKIFPGDSFTYGIGALIAIVAIFGDMERIALFLFAPYVIEFFLKARYNFKIESFGMPSLDGTIAPPEKIGSLTHIFMSYFKTEKKTVLGLLGTEALLAAAALIFYI